MPHIIILDEGISKILKAGDKMTQVETGEAYGQFAGLGTQETEDFNNAKDNFTSALAGFSLTAENLETAGNGLTAYLPPEE